jgi:hypothetical protein
MAELKGPFIFTGSIGNIRAYYDKALKKYFVSTKGGAAKELILNNDSMERQRENMSEFTGCSKWASQLRKSLESISHLIEGYYFPGLLAMGKLIQKQDDLGDKGHRSIRSSLYARLLSTYNFNKIHPFDQVFAGQYVLEFLADKQTVKLTLSGFVSASRINWPERFASYRITLVIAQLPDWVWNPANRRFEPVVPHLIPKSITAFTEWHDCSTEPEDIILAASFPQPALQQPGTIVVAAIGIEVSAYPLQSTIINSTGVGTMKIAACYVD